MKTSIAIISVLIALSQINPIAANDIDKLLQKLKQAVDDAVAKANATIENAKVQVDKTAQFVEQQAQSVMQGAEDGFKQQLDALKEKAKQAGVNIDDCLGADEQRLVNLPTEGTNNMVGCISGKINQAFSYAQDGLNKIQKVVDEIATIRQEIKDCGHGFHAVQCLAKLALKIEKDIVTLPDQIAAEAAASAALIVNLDQEVKQCASNAEDGMESEGKALVEKISICVAKHIIHYEYYDRVDVFMI